MAPPITWNPPLQEDVGSLLPYPRMMDPSNPGVSYSWDGIPVPPDHFFQVAHRLMGGSFGMLNAAAKASAPRVVGFSVHSYQRGGIVAFGVDQEDSAVSEALENENLTIHWLVSNDWGLDVSSMLAEPCH